ncbi:hypothetical protein SpAn4DRAFT_4104 [Sporomusa ovata]|uniref:Uncharacterized protein n=1 Tax=Sporomusa ovata TaxID=2378 RepID=A0A0U1L4W3_9FIRM|nr:hypothetical protein SpAn4DRAFT_4104 [Sporomusa ovata]
MKCIFVFSLPNQLRRDCDASHSLPKKQAGVGLFFIFSYF